MFMHVAHICCFLAHTERIIDDLENEMALRLFAQ